MKQTQLIGITGLARSGKDTLADMLAANLGWDRYSFATPIKNMIAVGLDLRDKQDKRAMEIYGKNYRHIAQTLGTEWGRELIHPDIWMIVAERRLKGTQTIISDVRFNNEAEFIRNHGILIEIVRPDQKKIEESEHASEDGVDILINDYRIINSGSLERMELLIRDQVVPDIEQLLEHKRLWMTEVSKGSNLNINEVITEESEDG